MRVFLHNCYWKLIYCFVVKASMPVDNLAIIGWSALGWNSMIRGFVNTYLSYINTLFWFYYFFISVLGVSSTYSISQKVRFGEVFQTAACYSNHLLVSSERFMVSHRSFYQIENKIHERLNLMNMFAPEAELQFVNFHHLKCGRVPYCIVLSAGHFLLE